MSEMKPCPFCGSEVQDDERGEKYPKKSPMGGWIIHCECCGASLSQFRKSGKGEISWNTRPIEDALNKRIAELSQAVGLITTLKPTMVMDANHPLDMVREVAEHVTARIAELEAEKCVLVDQQREAKNHLIDKNLHIDSLYEEGYKLQQRIAELEGKIDQLTAHGDIER